MYFLVARKPDGSPAFIEVISTQNISTGKNLESLKKSITTSLLCREDVETITIHKVTAATTQFDLIDAYTRDERIGFYQCYTCSQVGQEQYKCSKCGRQTCRQHRKPEGKRMFKWLCLDCEES